MKSFILLLLTAPLALAAQFIATQGDVIPGKWIVVMKKGNGISDKNRGLAVEALATPRHSFTLGGFKAYAMDASDEMINKIAELDEVRFGKL